MSKIINFDKSPEYKVQKAQEYYDLEEFDVALPLLFDALKQKPDNVDIKLFIARIYAEMSQLDLSTEMCFSALADGYNAEAVKGIISNLMCQGDFKDARFYNQNFKVDFDFSDFLTVETNDGEVIYGGDDDFDEADERRKQFKLTVYKKSKDGENLIKAKDLQDMTVEDLEGLSDAGTFNFGELMEKLLSFDDVDAAAAENPRRTEIGFKQVYPVPKKECETTISKAFELFSAGKAEDSLNLLSTITPDCGKYYYLACKNRVMCYLALNRLASMKAAAEEAIKGLPNDYTLKCYYYMSLKLLEEDEAATKVFDEIMEAKPSDLMEYMVKMDVCRLAMYHKGIIDCADRILDELPYQPQILVLRGKAEFNEGLPKVARATFLEVTKLYPDNFEARMLIRKIADGGNGLMTYGDIDLAIKRVKLLSEYKTVSSDGVAFVNYLQHNKDAIPNIEFLLLNEGDMQVNAIVSGLRRFMSSDVENLFKKLLLKIDASEYLKSVIITYYLFSVWPKKIAVTVGKKLTMIDLPQTGWEKGLNEMEILAADTSLADFIMHDAQPKKNIHSLIERMKRVSDYILSEKSDRETVRNFTDIKDGVALKKAFTDITRHTVRKTPPLSLQDEKYNECLSILKKIEDEYEI